MSKRPPKMQRVSGRIQEVVMRRTFSDNMELHKYTYRTLEFTCNELSPLK